MRYYVNNNNLFATTVPFADSCFTEIDLEEYEKRVNQAEEEREEGKPFEFVSGNGVEIW